MVDHHYSFKSFDLVLFHMFLSLDADFVREQKPAAVRKKSVCMCRYIKYIFNTFYTLAFAVIISSILGAGK